jgi:amphi-Trp domain-containing protein
MKITAPRSRFSACNPFDTTERCRLTDPDLSDRRQVAGGVFKPVASVYSRMPEEVLFETERRMDRNDIASYLRTVAEKLESGGDIALSAGDQSVTLAPPARPTFEVKAERETPNSGGPGELSIEFELEWDEDGGDGRSTDASLEIE